MNRTILFMLVLISGMVFSNGVGAQSTELEVYISEYPPFCFTKDGKVTGFATEVVSEIMKRIGVSYKIRSLPWKRAYQYISEKPNVVLFTVTRTDSREARFKWVGPITTSSLVFFAKHDSDIQIRNLEDAKKLQRIGTVQGYSAEKYLLKEGFTNLDAVSGSEKGNPFKLMYGRIDLWATVDMVGIYNARLQGIDPKNMKIVYTILEQPKYIAFSRQVDDLTVQRWQTALDEIKKDGTFENILNNWMTGFGS